MKLIINPNQIDSVPETFLQKSGYTYIEDKKMGHSSFVRKMGGGRYPRLHVYIKKEGNKVIFDLHLDQKQASYDESHMHCAEYDGLVVVGEITRLRDLIVANMPSGAKAHNPSSPNGNINNFEHGVEENTKKDLLGGLFNRQK